MTTTTTTTTTTKALQPLSPLFGRTLDELVAVERAALRRRLRVLATALAVVAAGVAVEVVSDFRPLPPGLFRAPFYERTPSCGCKLRSGAHR